MLYGNFQVSGALEVAAAVCTAAEAAVAVRLGDMDVAGHQRAKVDGCGDTTTAKAHAGVGCAVV